MQSLLNVDFWANAASMMQSGHPSGALLVTGSEGEAKLLSSWLAPRARFLIVGVDVADVVARCATRATAGIVGLVGSPPPEASRDLASVDFGDVESMTVGSPVLGRYLVEVAGPEWVSAARDRVGDVQMHILKLSVLETELGADVDLVPDSMMPRTAEHEQQFARLREVSIDQLLWRLRGQTALRAVCRAITECRPGGISAQGVASEADLARLLRLGYSDEEFSRTRLHWRLLVWGMCAPRLPVIRSLHRSDPLGVFIDQCHWSLDFGRAVDGVHEWPACVVQLDMDHFGQINKALGHHRGDEAIAQYGRIVGEVVSGRGLAYRRGGDEAVLVLPGLNESEAVAIAGTIRERIELEMTEFVGDHGRSPTVSIGVLELRPGMPASQAIELVDRAQRRAKELGRNRVVPASALEPA